MQQAAGLKKKLQQLERWTEERRVVSDEGMFGGEHPVVANSWRSISRPPEPESATSQSSSILVAARRSLKGSLPPSSEVQYARPSSSRPPLELVEAVVSGSSFEPTR